MIEWVLGLALAVLGIVSEGDRIAAAWAASEWRCDIDYACAAFVGRCDELAIYWDMCPGDPSRLDRDGDGVPCEATCQ